MSAEETPDLTIQVEEILAFFDDPQDPHKLFWSKYSLLSYYLANMDL